MTSSRARHRHDQRTRQDRNASSHAAWTTQMPVLVSVFLASKSHTDGMNVDLDGPGLGHHVFQIDILGLRGKYSQLHLKILT
jgi:hypothetical protein